MRIYIINRGEEKFDLFVNGKLEAEKQNLHNVMATLMYRCKEYMIKCNHDWQAFMETGITWANKGFNPIHNKICESRREK